MWHCRYSFVYWMCTKASVLEIVTVLYCVIAPLFALFTTKRCVKLLFVFVGNDAPAVHLHNGPRA